jgi:hypothetical protein
LVVIYDIVDLTQPFQMKASILNMDIHYI